jgi:hypothetical protein
VKSIEVFCEDELQESVLTGLLRRMEEKHGVPIGIRPVSVSGGAGQMLSALDEYVSDLRGLRTLPDLIVVGRDSNCRGVAETQDELDDHLQEFADFAIYAIPNPHVERWLLVDEAAFAEVFGTGCDAPDEKCDKDRYKEMLAGSIRNSALDTSLDGLEQAGDVVAAMDFDRMTTADDSLGTFLSTLGQQFRQWT